MLSGKIEKIRILLQISKRRIAHRIKLFKLRRMYRFTYKNVFISIIILIYAVFSYIYAYNSVEKESVYLADSLSKNISYISAKITDYIKVNTNYYNNVFESGTPREHYILDSLVWNTDDFYTLDSMNDYTVYNYGNITGFGSKDNLETYRSELSLVLNDSDIYRDFYQENQNFVSKILYTSKNDFAYVYPYMVSGQYSYADRLRQEGSFTDVTELDDVVWSSIFVDEGNDEFAVSIFKDVAFVENDITTNVGTFAVDIHVPKLQILDKYEYYVVDTNLDILSTNNAEVTPNRGVRKIYELKNTFENSSLSENILASEENFLFDNEIYTSNSIAGTPLYFVISKKYIDVSKVNLEMLGICIFMLFVCWLILGESDYRKEQVERLKVKLMQINLSIDVLEDSKNIDGLTKAYTREYVVNKCKEFWTDRKDFIILMIDIDHYRNFNESYGRTVGDRELQKIVYLMGKVIGRNAPLGRYTGTRFIYLLETNDIRKAMEVAEKFRSSVEEEYFSIENELCARLSVSCGISLQKYMEGADYLDTIDEANKAVVEAKNKARNKVIVYKK
ncbi:MAG: GGDEF domain-containing protein [Lachnospirales bacterium]